MDVVSCVAIVDSTFRMSPWVPQAVLIAAVAAAVSVAGSHLARGQVAALKALVPVALFAPVATAVVLGLGLTGFATPLGFLTLGVVVLALLPAHFVVTSRYSRQDRPKARVGIPALILGSLGCLAGYLIGRVHPGVHFTPDDLTYHAAWVGELATRHQLGLFPQNYHAYYPFNAEAFAAFFVLPLGADGLAYVAGVYWLSLACLTAWSAVRLSGGERYPAGLAVIFVAGESATKLGVHSFAAVDLAGPTSILAAAVILCGWRVQRPPSSGPAATATGFGFDSRSLSLAGVLAGMSLGCKVSMLVWLAVLFAHVCVVTYQEAECDRLAMRLLTIIGAVAVLGIGWYLRNLWLTGNPVFPGNLGPFEGAWSQEAQTRTTLWYWLVGPEARPWRVASEHLLHAAQAWPLALSIPLLWLARRNSVRAIDSATFEGPSRPVSVRLGGLLLVLVLTQFAAYPFMPFSGTNYSASAELRVSSRFVLGGLMGVATLAAMGLSHVRSRTLMTASALVAVGIGEGVAIFGFGKPALNAILTIALIGAWWVLDLTFKILPTPIHSAILENAQRLALHPMWCTGAVALGLVGAWPATQARTDEARKKIQIKGAALGLAGAALGESPDTVAVTGPGRDSYYPLFGSPYCRRVLVLEESGRPASLLPIAATSAVEERDPMQTMPEMTIEHLIYAGAPGAPAEFRARMAHMDAAVQLDRPNLILWRMPGSATNQQH